MNIKQAERLMLRVADLRPNEGQIQGVPANPRYISEADFKALCNSLLEDDLTGVLQMKVYDHAGEWVVLDGNMRLKALQEIGIEDVECIVVPQDAPAKVLRKIVALSNSTFGEWDFDMLANEWDAEELNSWGVDVPGNEADQFGTEFTLPEGEKEPFQQMTFSLADEQAEMIKQAIEEAKGLEEYKHQDTYGNTNSNGNAIAVIIAQWLEYRK